MHSGIDCQIPDSFLGDTPKLRAYESFLPWDEEVQKYCQLDK